MNYYPINNELYHYGIPRRSGRYPWGSGNRPYQSLTTNKNKISYGDFHYKPQFVKNVARDLGSDILQVIPGVNIAYSLYTVKKFSDYNLDRKDYMKKEGSPEKLSELKTKTKEMDIMSDMKEVNPRTSKGQRGKINNCAKCTVAMEMRRRGYDVQARSAGSGVIATDFANWFENVRFGYPVIERNRWESRRDYSTRAYDSLVTAIQSDGPNTRGALLIQYEKVRGGHAVFYESKDGKVTFYDAQNNTTDLDNVLSAADPSSHLYIRLDNLKLKPQITTQVVSKKE